MELVPLLIVMVKLLVTDDLLAWAGFILNLSKSAVILDKIVEKAVKKYRNDVKKKISKPK